jgi:hypothetical protein
VSAGSKRVDTRRTPHIGAPARPGGGPPPLAPAITRR